MSNGENGSMLSEPLRDCQIKDGEGEGNINNVEIKSK